MATVSTMGLVSKQASIEALSGKLLEGYTLLAESCPAGCNVPLVRAAAGGESLCVSCGGNPPAPRAAQTPQRAAAASPAPAPATQPARSPEVRPLQLGSVQFGASPEPAAAAVLTEEEEGVTGGVPEAPGVPEESGLELREVFSAEARARSDEASNRLAEKLLAGYTMLAQVSPYDGVTPLVRSRKGRRYCVSSGLWLDPPSEGDEAAQEAAAGAPKGPLGAAPPAGVRVIPLEEAPEELKALVRQQQSKQQPKQEMQPEPEPAAAEVEVEVEAAAGPEAAAAPLRLRRRRRRRRRSNRWRRLPARLAARRRPSRRSWTRRTRRWRPRLWASRRSGWRCASSSPPPPRHCRRCGHFSLT